MAKKLSPHENLLTKLIKIQQVGKYSDYRFAKKLRVSRSTWQLTRTNTVKIGITLLSAVLKTYPELSEDVLNFLRDDHKHECD